MIDARYVVTELQEMREEGHLSDALLRYAVRTLHKSDDRYDWVGVYLLSDDRLELWLHNYMGSPTEHAKIPVGEGVCGTAVAHGANQNVPDVSHFPGYLACSPEVKSELVVLIRAGGEIFGQLDIDSNRQKWRRNHEYDEKDEHHVYERCDIDFRHWPKFWVRVPITVASNFHLVALHVSLIAGQVPFLIIPPLRSSRFQGVAKGSSQIPMQSCRTHPIADWRPQTACCRKLPPESRLPDPGR